METIVMNKNKKGNKKTSKGKKVTYLLICVFVLLPGRLCAFCAFYAFCVFYCVRNLSVAK